MNINTTEHNYVAAPGEIEGIVKKFSKEIVAELGVLVKSVAFFGSAVKGGFVAGKKSLRDEALFGSDIDVLIIFDDLISVMSSEVITAYRVITENTAAKISKRLHITTMPITKFWDYAMKGDPILINMLRDGEPVYDVGCFGMAKKMVGSKNISASKEIVWIYLGRGPMSIANANWNVRQAVLDLYWAVVDAAHAALLHHSIVPDAPDNLVGLFNDSLRLKGVVSKRDVSVLAEFMNIGHLVMSSEVSRISGDNYDRYKKEAEEFIHKVKEILASG